MDRTHVQRTDQHLCYRPTKEPIGKAEPGGKMYQWRRLSDVPLMPICAADDPTYAPMPKPPNKERPFIPVLKERGASRAATVTPQVASPPAVARPFCVEGRRP